MDCPLKTVVVAPVTMLAAMSVYWKMRVFIPSMCMAGPALASPTTKLAARESLMSTGTCNAALLSFREFHFRPSHTPNRQSLYDSDRSPSDQDNATCE